MLETLYKKRQSAAKHQKWWRFNDYPEREYVQADGNGGLSGLGDEDIVSSMHIGKSIAVHKRTHMEVAKHMEDMIIGTSLAGLLTLGAVGMGSRNGLFGLGNKFRLYGTWLNFRRPILLFLRQGYDPQQTMRKTAVEGLCFLSLWTTPT